MSYIVLVLVGSFARLAWVGLLLGSAAGCGGPDRESNSGATLNPGVAPANLEEALSLRHGDSTLGEILDFKLNRRYAADTVIAFRTELGADGAKWLARAIESKYASDPERAFALLDLDLDAVLHAKALVVRWVRGHASAQVRITAARLLLHAGDRDQAAIDTIVGAIEGADPLAALHAAAQVSILGGDVKELTEPLLAYVERCRRSHGPVEIEDFAAGVAHADDREDFCGLILQTLSNPASDIEDLIPRLESLLRRPRSDRASILLVLGNRGTRASPAVPAIIELCRCSEPEVRGAAARALGGIGLKSDEVAATLRQLLNDDDEQVRVAAEQARSKLRITAD